MKGYFIGAICILSITLGYWFFKSSNVFLNLYGFTTEEKLMDAYIYQYQLYQLLGKICLFTGIVGIISLARRE